MVAIEDFEMPVSCKECIFHGNYGMCQLSGYFEDEDYTNTERSVDCPLVEAIPKADYENRLKADMVAMLEEIDLEMSEQSFGIQTEPWEVVEKLRKKIIQQKINALKAETEDQNGQTSN